MKHEKKPEIKGFVKRTGMGLMLAVSLLLTSAFCALPVSAEALPQALSESLLGSIEDLTRTIISLDDEQIADFQENGNAFTQNAMESWLGAREDLGNIKESQAEADEPEITLEGKTYTVTYPVEFEKADADFIYTLDQELNPSSLVVNVNLPLGTNMLRATLNTIMGICIVFLVLLLLSFVISLFKYIPQPGAKPGKAAPAPEKAAPQPAVEEEEEDDLAIIAVVTAAIAAMEGTSPDGFVVRSIRKSRAKA